MVISAVGEKIFRMSVSNKGNPLPSHLFLFSSTVFDSVRK